MHIWGDADRYLCTWESAGQRAIEEYSKIANIKDSIIVNDAELDPAIQNVNILRMVYLWQKMANLVPKGYNKYVIIRPDGFYFTKEIQRIPEIIINSPSLSVNSVSFTEKTVSDNILILDSLAYLMCVFDEILSIYLDRHEKLLSTCIHYMLFELLVEIKGKNPQYLNLEHTVFPVFVRSTFALDKKDVYDWNLYSAIFYDSAVWWRKNVHTAYHGRLIPEL